MSEHDAQAALDAQNTPHAGLARRLFAYRDGALVPDELTRACRDARPDAPVLMWVAIVLADFRIAEILEEHLTRPSGEFDPERYNAADLTEALMRDGVGSAQKVASNILRYVEAAGLVEPVRVGSTVTGIDFYHPPDEAVPVVVRLIRERVAAADPAATEDDDRFVEDLIHWGVNNWIGLGEDRFRWLSGTVDAAPGGSSDEVPEVEPAPHPSPMDDFSPKDEGEYEVETQARRQTKSRRHETLVNQYQAWASDNGFGTASPHPVDLMLTMGNERWLVEAKVIYRGNATDAVRAVIGQVLEYQWMLYRDEGVKLVGLFTGPVGDAYVGLLTEVGIACVWSTGQRWEGSDLAVSWGLAEAT